MEQHFTQSIRNRLRMGGLFLGCLAATAWAAASPAMAEPRADIPMVEAGVAGLSARQLTVSGRVTSAADGSLLAGVSVSGGSAATQTDANGVYSIAVPADGTLVFSYLGFAVQSVAVGGRFTIDVALKPGTANLDEVVVVGYGTLSRREVTSAIASVKAEDFNSGGSRSPVDLVQGKVAGLQITRAEGNNPNAGASIQLRGVTSLTGDRTPLIVIDGIPGGSLDLIQQDDIESFDVLKDGSAAAIYGTRGNAGVILITTKKGRAGAPQFDYSTYVQREVVDKKPEFLSAAEFRSLIAQGRIDAANDFGSSTDLYNELIDRGNTSHYHNFSAMGGAGNANYRASLFYNDMNGIAKRNGREAFGGRINVNQTGLQDRLKLSANLVANFVKQDRLGGNGSDFEQAIQRNPTAPIQNPDGSFVETPAYNNYNPMARLANRVDERAQQILSGDARAEITLLEGLTASAFGSYQTDGWNDRRYRSTQDWDQRPTGNYQGTGYAYKRNEKSTQQTFESTLNYTAQSAADHSLAGLLGYSYQYATTEWFEMNSSGFLFDDFQDWNMAAGSAMTNTSLPRPGMGSSKEDNTLVAFFGRVNYSYKNRYFLQGILRREGSSRFGANNKWGNFPAVSASWALSEEAFMAAMPQVDHLKLRVGFGITGNQGIPNYRSLVTLSSGGSYLYDGVYLTTYGAAQNPNLNLRWEQKAEWNFGLDFGILGNRITGSIDYYDRETRDLLYDYFAQQPSSIRNRILTNVGSIRNSGLEVQISAAAVQKDSFRWTVDLTASYQANKLSKLSNESYQANFLEFAGLPAPGNLGSAIRLEEGGKIGNFYGKRFAGFDNDGKWQFYKADGSIVTGSTGLNQDDLTVIGNGVPKYNLSLGNTFGYRGFDLSVFFRGKFGFDILNVKDMYFGNAQWLPNNLLRSAITTHARLNDATQYSDYYLENGSFVKLDNLTLGYTFPLKTPYVRNMRMYVTGRNILTITGYSGTDPELQDTGFEAGMDNRGFYPRTQSWAVGLNIGF